MTEKESHALRMAADEIWEIAVRLRQDGHWEASEEVKNVSSLLHGLAAGYVKGIVRK